MTPRAIEARRGPPKEKKVTNRGVRERVLFVVLAEVQFCFYVLFISIGHASSLLTDLPF